MRVYYASLHTRGAIPRLLLSSPLVITLPLVPLCPSSHNIDASASQRTSASRYLSTNNALLHLSTSHSPPAQPAQFASPTGTSRQPYHSKHCSLSFRPHLHPHWHLRHIFFSNLYLRSNKLIDTIQDFNFAVVSSDVVTSWPSKVEVLPDHLLVLSQSARNTVSCCKPFSISFH